VVNCRTEALIDLVSQFVSLVCAIDKKMGVLMYFRVGLTVNFELDVYIVLILSDLGLAKILLQ